MDEADGNVIEFIWSRIYIEVICMIMVSYIISADKLYKSSTACCFCTHDIKLLQLDRAKHTVASVAFFVSFSIYLFFILVLLSVRCTKTCKIIFKI